MKNLRGHQKDSVIKKNHISMQYLKTLKLTKTSTSNTILEFEIKSGSVNAGIWVESSGTCATHYFCSAVLPLGKCRQATP